jgi:hypothetical protein
VSLAEAAVSSFPQYSNHSRVFFIGFPPLINPSLQTHHNHTCSRAGAIISLPLSPTKIVAVPSIRRAREKRDPEQDCWDQLLHYTTIATPHHLCSLDLQKQVRHTGSPLCFFRSTTRPHRPLKRPQPTNHKPQPLERP